MVSFVLHYKTYYFVRIYVYCDRSFNIWAWFVTTLTLFSTTSSTFSLITWSWVGTRRLLYRLKFLWLGTYLNIFLVNKWPTINLLRLTHSIEVFKYLSSLFFITWDITVFIIVMFHLYLGRCYLTLSCSDHIPVNILKELVLLDLERSTRSRSQSLSSISV